MYVILRRVAAFRPFLSSNEWPFATSFFIDLFVSQTLFWRKDFSYNTAFRMLFLSPLDLPIEFLWFPQSIYTWKNQTWSLLCIRALVICWMFSMLIANHHTIIKSDRLWFDILILGFFDFSLFLEVIIRIGCSANYAERIICWGI